MRYIASDLSTKRPFIADEWHKEWPIYLEIGGIGRVLFDRPEVWPLRWQAYMLRAFS